MANRSKVIRCRDRDFVVSDLADSESLLTANFRLCMGITEMIRQVRCSRPQDRDRANVYGPAVQTLKANPKGEALLTSEGASLSVPTRRHQAPC